MDRAPTCQTGSVLAPYEAGAPSRLRHLVISTLIALALVSHTALTSLHAQPPPPIDDWAETGGTVELSTSMDATDGVRSLNLPIRKEKSATYYLRLNKQPEASGWWVRVHVDGAVYIDGVLAEKGIWWVPSVGWEINKNGSGPTPWRSVTIYATEDSDADGEPVNVTHEVWDEYTNCPPSLHGIAPVTVRIIDSGDGGGDGNGDGNGGGGGDGNGDGNGGGGGDGNGDGNGGGGGDGNGGGGGDGDGGGDDEPPGLSIDDAPAVREGESAAFVVQLSAASGAAVTVAYETRDGTAVAGVDYTSTSGTLRFDAGETNKTIAVPTLEDATAEETEGFTVQLRDPSGATVADGTATGTITDDDEPPGLSIDDAPAVREGESAAFVVQLSAASGAAVTVAYETRDGTAVAGVDYTSTSGTLRFDAGETNKTIAVPTLEDATAEETEGFTVQLRDPSGATVADGTATGTITDDDEPPGLSIDDAPAVREGESAAFVVQLSAASGAAVTVAYETRDGTAVAGVDYTSTSGTLRFDAGETNKTIAVPTLEDATAEETEGFTVQLRDPSGATVADGTATGTITDDDEPPGLSIDDAPAVREGESAAFVVQLSAASGAAVTVAYETRDGTAVAGVDYTSTSGTLRFDAGETNKTIAVPTLEDATAEETEGFTVQLRDPSGATVADGTATGTITDDDERRIEVVNDVVLPEVGRALAFSAVRCRIDQVLSGSAPRGTSTELSAHLALSPEARSGQWAAPGVQSPTLVQAFDDSLFLMQSQEEEDGEGRFAAWWCPDYQNLGGGGRGGGITWDGAVSSWHAGADARIGPGLLAGVSFSRSRGSFDYQGGGRNLDAGRGIYAVGLVSIHPYLAWSVLPDLDVWGTVGHAWGDLRVVDAAAGNVLTSPATLDSGVVGVSGRLLTRGATTLRLKGEWALAQMNVARASTAFDAATVDMQRLRMGAEVSYHHALSSGASLIPWGEVGLRHDGGDGEIGAGLELGGGLRHQNPEAGVTVEGHGRGLLIHRGTLREWGVGGLVRFAPKAGGRGLSVSLMPTWGESASGVQQLLERGATDPHLQHSAPGARLDAEFGYGFGALRDRSVLTPYVGLSLVGEAARGYRLGGRLAAGQSATVSLEAERRQYLAAARTHALLLLGTLQF